MPDAGHRKTSRGDDRPSPAVQLVDEVWEIRSHDAVRQVLRAGAHTHQAGFNAELVRKGRPHARQPVLFADGEEHRAQRKAIARYFAPATVSKRYRGLMETRADALVAEIASAGHADLATVTLRYSVEVAAQVVGLTNSDPDKMARRLQSFFDIAPVPAGAGQSSGRFDRVLAAARTLRALPPMARFRKQDVQPAIEARRAQPQQDVISHLLEAGYNDEEILIECITYGAAGMVTTREFISMAVWHLLADPQLVTDYLAADEKERYRVLDEIVRLEPVVGHLYRRADEPIEITDGDHSYTIPAGSLMDLYIRAANADEDAVGADPLELCPTRQVAAGVRDEALAFGDGNHRCPGNHIAIQETDIFLTRLLPLGVRLVGTPRLDWDELISGYAVRDIRIEVAAPTEHAEPSGQA